MLPAITRFSINTMTVSIARILQDREPSIYLYGSAAADDFCPGWSDIDVLVLTKRPISEDQADQLLTLRQHLLAQDPENPCYRAFEGAMLHLDAFLTGESTRVVYWGTRGECFKSRHTLTAFDRYSLLTDGLLLHGRDVRYRMRIPDFDELKQAVHDHMETLRLHGRGSRSRYAFGWLLDIARCLYTLLNEGVTTKSAAGEWVLQQFRFPAAAELRMALQVRRNPALLEKPAVLDEAEALTGAIQRCTELLALAYASR